MKWHASIFTVEQLVEEDPCSTQRVLQLALVFEADDEESARQQLMAVMPAVAEQLGTGPSLISDGDGPVLGGAFDLTLVPLAQHITTCENRYKELKRR